MAEGIGAGGRGAGGPQDTFDALEQRRVEILLLAPDYERREEAVRAALLQDAEVLVVHHHPDLGPFQGIGAVLRF